MTRTASPATSSPVSSTAKRASPGAQIMAPRSGERFVLGYLNVDRMKVVNDTGSRGDEILRKVTAALRATLRSYDVIARLGGDEFLFSLPGSDMATAELRFKEFAVILSEEAPGCDRQRGLRRPPRTRHTRRPRRRG